MDVREGENGSLKLDVQKIEITDPTYNVYLGKNSHRFSNAVEGILKDIRPYVVDTFPKHLETGLK